MVGKGFFSLSAMQVDAGSRATRGNSPLCGHAGT